MGYITYPRTSGGQWNDCERQQVEQDVNRQYGAEHIPPKSSLDRIILGTVFKADALKKMDSTNLSVEEVLHLVRTLPSYPGAHSGTKVYYDPVRHVSVLVGASGAILGVYHGRINGKLDKKAIYEQIQKRKEEAFQDTRKAQIQNRKPEEKPPKKLILPVTPVHSPNAIYASHESLKASAVVSTGFANFESAVAFVDIKEDENGVKINQNRDKEFLPPYQADAPVEILTIKQKQVFIRLHGNNSRQDGAWIMLKEDYERLSIEEIRQQYAIPPGNDLSCVSEVIFPSYYTKKDVTSKKHIFQIQLCRGRVAPDLRNGYSGGGTQYQILRSQFEGGRIPSEFFTLLS
jgi:hypothetical protein